MNQGTFSLTPLKPSISKDTKVLPVLVRLAAPLERPVSIKRKPLNVGLVLDRSGSMQGRPLDEAKRCAQYVVQTLEPSDVVSVVAFDHDVDVIAPATRVADGKALIQAINRLGPGGNTALHGGWLRAAEQVAEYVSVNNLSRVFLLTDGIANVGICDPDRIANACAQMAAAGVSTSTCGLGNSFNEELLGKMAEAGQGQAHYAERAEDLHDPFLREFDLLAALWARKVRLTVKTADGIVARIRNNYSQDAEARAMLPDVAYAGEAWALIDLELPSGRTVADEPLLTCTVEYQGGAADQQTTMMKALTVSCVSAAEEASLSPDPLVDARVMELRAADLQDEARSAARRGDWDEVQTLLDLARQESVGNRWVEEALVILQAIAAERDMERFSREVFYKGSAMRRRLASSSENSGDYDADTEGTLPSYLRRKLEQGRS